MASQQNRPVLGSLYMMASMALYVCNDSLVKLVGEKLPLGSIISVRGVFALGLLLLAIMANLKRPINWSGLFHRQVLLRAGLDTVSTFLFLTGLMKMSIAAATSILQTIPLVVVVFGTVFLKERIGWRRISAIILGFVGVLLIIKPGTEGFNAYSLLIVATVFLVAFRDTVTRQIPADTPSLLITLMNVVMVTAAGAVYAGLTGFSMPAVSQLMLLGLAAAFLVIATLMAIMTMRVADISSTAPFRYSAILWSLLSAYLIFSQVPDTTAIIGIVMIAVSGVYALNRTKI